MKLKLFKIGQISQEDEFDVPLFSICKENEKPKELTEKSLNDLLKHYKFFENGETLVNANHSSFKFVNISTAQRCGTWWHKYFFKFYSDLVAQYPVHIGLKLRNPFYCEELKTLFFVGHMPFPQKNIININLATNKFLQNNFLRVKQINPGYFNNYTPMLELFKMIDKRVKGFKFKKFYYIYRNVFDQFISSFLMAKRSNIIEKKFSLFHYTKNFLIEPFAYQFLSFQVAQQKTKSGTVKIIRYDDILLDQTNHFRELLMDFGVPLHEDKLSEAIILSSKKFLGQYERVTGLTINESINDGHQIKHIAYKDEKKDVQFTNLEKKYIKNRLIKYGLYEKFFPEFNLI